MQLIGRVFLLALCVFSAYSFPNTIKVINGKISAEDVLNEIENIFYTHYRGSNQSNSNNTNNNQTRPPSNNDTNINPPNHNNTRPPNNNDTNINPPNNNDTNLNPPNNNNTNNNDTNNNNNSTINVDLCFYKFTNQQNNQNQKTIKNILSCFQLSNNQSSNANNKSSNATVDEVNFSSYRLQFRLSNCAAKDSNDDVFNCYVNSFDRNLEDLSDIAEKSALAEEISAGNYTNLEIAQRACVSSVVSASKSDSIRVLNELENCVNRGGNSTSHQGRGVVLY